MAANISSANTLKIQRALDQYPHWQSDSPLCDKPVIAEQLTGGRSNISLRVSSGEQQFVLRLDGINPQRLGLNRNAELRIQQAASLAGLAPQPIYFNPELGVLVSRYCPEQEPDWQPREELQAIAELLRQIHQLPPVKYRLQALDRARLYIAMRPKVEAHGEQKLRIDQELQSLAQALQDSAAPCLCHNDLLAANRLFNGKQLLAIDWEYAATGDPYFELAAICEGDALAAEDALYFLNCYLERTPTEEQIQRLSDYRRVYLYLAQLWEQVTEL
jgi:thiamine kinase